MTENIKKKPRKGGKRIPLNDEKRVKISELRADGIKAREIAKELGVSLSAIFKYGGRLGGSKYTAAQLQTVIIKNNYNLAAVGRELGVHRTFISQIARQAGVLEWFFASRKKYRKELAEKIVELHKNGVSVDAIAEIVNKSLIFVAKKIQENNKKK